jgi:predicted nucleotidyltransferase
MNVIEIPEVKNFLNQLSHFLEIESVLCYGSYATGYHDQKSDIDLLILVDKLPQKKELQEIYHKFKGFHKIELKELDHWNSSWTLMNGSLEAMNGMKIEPGFNTIEWTETVMKKLLENHEISFEEFPFRPYTFLGLLEHSQCIYEAKLNHASGLPSRFRR